ncbi:hypothetical protein [Aurantimonas sp. Leaf443]|uniref:hypothetical protein n=1 Tax=Aurantimonas sp. Leaf443 TaxID=1736378 RepID=UPI0006F7C7B0|nr:hypothetical protein [Aurantimonas sp. Leaf443]KQT87461.1 hypothetical protein ASG48_16835 [Aurantimonas sp. Leaf443]
MSNCALYEPTIDEIMADPTVLALMKADRVNTDRLRSKLFRLGELMALREGASRPGALPLRSDHAAPGGPAGGPAFG